MSVDQPDMTMAVVKATGEKQMIPAHWLDHPTLSKPFKLPPSARAAALDQGVEVLGAEQAAAIADSGTAAVPAGAEQATVTTQATAPTGGQASTTRTSTRSTTTRPASGTTKEA